MKKAFCRIISFVLALSALVFPLASCSKYNFPESTEEDTETVLIIGDYEVPFEQYRYFFMNFKAEYDGGSDSYWRSLGAKEKSKMFYVIDDLVRAALLRCYATFSLALDHGIDYKSGAVQKEVVESINDSIEKDFGGFDAYLDAIAAAHMTHSVYRFAMSELEVEERLFEAMKEDGSIKSDADTVRAAVESGEFCRAKQVLIMNDEGEKPEDNRKEAENVLLLAQLGQDFDKLVADYGEDPEMITNPEGYYFVRGELIEEFENAAFALKIGELSDIISSPLGYHIILRLEPDEDYINENISTLGDTYAAGKFRQAVDDRGEDMEITATDFWRTLTIDNFFYGE